MTQASPPDSTTPKKAARSVPSWVVIVSFVILFAFLAFIGFGLKRAQAGPISIGAPMPAVTLTTYDGQTINTQDLAGKVIVVNFWASWCKPCEQEAADLEAAWRAYQPGDQVVFLGIAWTDTEPEALGYLEKFQITYPNGPDLGTRNGDRVRITGVPETYFIDRNGNLAYVKKGPFLGGVAEISAVIDDLLAP